MDEGLPLAASEDFSPMQSPGSILSQNNEQEGNGLEQMEFNKVCPLCKSEVHLFFINYNEKMLMCENYRCEFPYGYEDLQFVKLDVEVHSDEEVASAIASSRNCPSVTPSLVSTAAWSELNHLNKAFEFDESQFEVKNFDLKDYLKSTSSVAKKTSQDKKILQNLRDIKELNKELDSKEEPVIKNEKWIRNLMALQRMGSGVQLVKENETVMMKKEQQESPLQITIDRASDNAADFNIRILNKPILELKKDNIENDVLDKSAIETREEIV